MDEKYRGEAVESLGQPNKKLQVLRMQLAAVQQHREMLFKMRDELDELIAQEEKASDDYSEHLYDMMFESFTEIQEGTRSPGMVKPLSDGSQGTVGSVPELSVCG